MDTRELIRQGLSFDQVSIMEIGPLNKPFIRKSETEVIYVDHADTTTLRQKYAVGHGFDPSEIVDVDAVWGQNSLSDCLSGRKVDFVIASHVIEHVPDLVTWLQELSSILTDRGEIRLVVPDKRFTFDYTRRTTEMTEVVDAHVRRARRPQAWNIIDHVLNVRAVDGHAAWQGPLSLEQLPPLHSFDQAVGVAKDAIESDNYHDVHCWVFTPASFGDLMASMVDFGLIDLKCEAFRDTQRDTIEFVVFMRRSTDRNAAISSWHSMTDEVMAPKDTSALIQPETLEGGAGLRVSNLNGHRQGLEESLRAAQRELAEIKMSRSWKITAPLRRIAGLMRGTGH